MSKIRLLEPWRSRLLWLSLGLNLFAAALIVTPHLWRRHPGPPNFDTIVERMARGLPPADAAIFRDAMDREHPWYDLGRKRLEEARVDVARTMAATPFDAAAVRAALESMQDRLHEGSARFDDSLIMALGKLTPEARIRLSESMRRGPR